MLEAPVAKNRFNASRINTSRAQTSRGDPLRKHLRRSVLVLLVISVPLWGQSGPAGNPKTNLDPTQILNPTLPVKGLVAKKPYEPITGRERVHWLGKSIIGPESLMAGVLSAGILTAANEPREFRPTWGGFAQRYGMRLTGVATGNAIEAGLGAIWGEDPRYDRAQGEPFGSRVWNVVKLTFAARYSDGHIAPAYARLVAIPGNNVLSNLWRAESETRVGDVVMRTALGVIGRMGANAFVEFWPDVRRRIRPGAEEPD